MTFRLDFILGRHLREEYVSNTTGFRNCISGPNCSNKTRLLIQYGFCSLDILQLICILVIKCSFCDVLFGPGHTNNGKPQYGIIYYIVHHADDLISDHLNVSIFEIFLGGAQYTRTLEALFGIFSATSFYNIFPDIPSVFFISTVCSQCFTWQHSV